MLTPEAFQQASSKSPFWMAVVTWGACGNSVTTSMPTDLQIWEVNVWAASSSPLSSLRSESFVGLEDRVVDRGHRRCAEGVLAPEATTRRGEG
jgi:hypothetical protein